MAQQLPNSSINYNLAPDEELVTCPYDPSHKVLKARSLRHLDLCRKNYRKLMEAKGSTVKFVACRWNFTHQVLEPELTFHYITCEDALAGKTTVFSGLHSVLNSGPNSKPLTRPVGAAASHVTSGEDWEAEAKLENRKCYNPKDKLKEGNIIYTPQGMTKSEKRAHREKERLRTGWSMKEPGEAGSASSSGKPYIPVGAPGWKS